MKHLLLLHGAIGAKDQLEPLAKQLSATYNVHLFNFSGHGGREVKNDFSIQGFAEELVAWLAENKIDRVNIFGYSMGGYVAMHIAVHHPEKVDKIITLGTKYKWDEETASKEVGMLNPSNIEAKVPKFATQLQQLHHPMDWKTVVQNTAGMLLAIGKNPPLTREHYASIKAEVLLMVGDRDKMVTIQETLDVYKLLSNGRLCVLPNTGHPVEQIDIDTVALLIQKFL